MDRWNALPSDHPEDPRRPSVNATVPLDPTANAAVVLEAVMRLRNKEASRNAETAHASRRLHEESEALQGNIQRATETADRAERETAAIAARQQTAEQEARRQLTQLQSALDQATKANALLQQRYTQLQHKVARKEKDAEKLGERLARQIQERVVRRGSDPIVALNDTLDDANRSLHRSLRLDSSLLDTTLSDAYEVQLAAHRADIVALQGALYAFATELASLTSHYAGVPVPHPRPEQYGAPLGYTHEPNDDDFQATLGLLRCSLRAAAVLPSPSVNPTAAPAGMQLDD